ISIPAPPNQTFNPRIPCGMRRSHRRPRLPLLRFQSTHPMRDATWSTTYLMKAFDPFNPRIPCGMRLDHQAKKTFFETFNPRIPCGMRPQHLVKKAFSQLNIGHTKYKKH
ncbi:hypothetical protein ACXO2W_05275, partial [Lactobacillus delbrueckii subsp. bulgaricus]